MSKKDMKKKRRKILGVNVDFGMTMDGTLEHIENLIDKGEGNHLVATTSPYFIMSAQEDLSDEMYEKIKLKAERYREYPIYYFDVSGTSDDGEDIPREWE